MGTWAKRIGLGLAAVATAAGAQLVATCAGQGGDCWKRAWVGALVAGVVQTVQAPPTVPPAPAEVQP
jgi:hypothetical protein